MDDEPLPVIPPVPCYRCGLPAVSMGPLLVSLCTDCRHEFLADVEHEVDADE